MTELPTKPRSDFALYQLLPNMLTITAICAGMTAIRFGVQENYLRAVQLILLACVLDGLDGRIARMLSADSKMGAELDSLADFINFGVAPPLVLFFWTLQDTSNAGWIAVLVFSVCCVVRLARFNVSSKSDEATTDSAFFVGVPAPAGALLVLMPLYVSFAFEDAPKLPDLVICIYMILIGAVMISRIPTWSFKATRISRENVKFFLVGFAFACAAILTYAWATLVVVGLAYVGTVIWALLTVKKRNNISR